MTRYFHVAVLCGLAVLLVGCSEHKEQPIWEHTKIGDLGPKYGNQKTPTQMLRSMSFSVRIFDVPAENADKLADLWEALYIRAIRFYSSYAFQANMFAVGYGDMRVSGAVGDALDAVNARRITNVSLLLADNEMQDVTIVPLSRAQPLSYVSPEGSREQADVGPGIISLRIKAVKVPGSRDSCSLVALPAFAVPMQSAIKQLADRARAREMQFTGAGFGVRMSPGDLIVLGPSTYISDDTMLPGLFFSNPQGGPFTDDAKAVLPQLKPAVRIFVILCTGVG